MDLVEWILSLDPDREPRVPHPTTRQCATWLRETGGIVRTSYTALTLAQQRMILADILDDSKEIRHLYVPLEYTRR